MIFSLNWLREPVLLLQVKLSTFLYHLNIFFLVIDVTREDSVSEAKSWIGSLLEGKTVPGVILANKTDLTERRTVPAKLGLDLASSLKMQYFECSAKDNVGVEEVFFYLANEFHKLHAEQASNIASIA